MNYDNKNFIIAIVLSMLVVFGWQYFYVGPKTERETKQQQQQTEQVQPGTAKPGAQVPSTIQAAVIGRDEAIKSSPRLTIKTDYVEEPDMKSVTLGAVNGLLESIDPYASFLSADQYKQYLKSKNQHKADVGLVLSKKFGYVGIVDAVPGSPAAKASPYQRSVNPFSGKPMICESLKESTTISAIGT